MKTKKGRKAPNDSATEFKVGFQKKGNDGNMWKVMKTEKGVKRWIKDDKILYKFTICLLSFTIFLQSFYHLFTIVYHLLPFF